jgi:hypothetical protein
MRNFLRDREHLARMAILFMAGLAVFLAARQLLVPRGFHEYGHFRAAALADNAARPIAYAGREACESCHAEVAEARRGSRHAGISCEVCHGALAKHADDPGSVTPPRPDARALCLGCHRQDPARPKRFPQVHPEAHMGSEACDACHKPHRPEQ